MGSDIDIGRSGISGIERWPPWRWGFWARESPIDNSSGIKIVVKRRMTLIDLDGATQHTLSRYRQATGTNIPQTDQVKRHGDRCGDRNESEPE
jgi:hypothetical protein